MRTIIPLIFSVFFLSSCGGHSEPQASMPATTPGIATTPGKDQPQSDPVCDMPREASWTDYTINNKDTIWFCSEGCKKAFMARPGKYTKH